MKRVIIAAFAALLILFGAALQAAVSSFTGPLTDLPIYVGAPQPYSYILDTNGTHTFAFNATTGQNVQTSTNASSILHSCYGNLSDGGKVLIRRGTYQIADNPTIRYDGIVTIGEGLATILNFTTATASIRLTKTSNLNYIGFYDLQLEGNDQTYYAIDSAGLSTTCRVRELKIMRCRVNNFVTCAFHLKNPELVTIEDNDFYDNGIDIRLYNDGYNAGNIFIKKNFLGHYDDGEIAVKVDCISVGKSFANLVSEANHFYADTTEKPDVEGIFLNATEEDIAIVESVNDRTENMGLYNSTTSGTAYIRYVTVATANIHMSADANVGIIFCENTTHAKVVASTISLGTNTTGVVDQGGTSGAFNAITTTTFVDNGDFRGAINGSTYTHAWGNTYCMATEKDSVPVGVKATNHRQGTQIHYWGTNTGGFSSATNYTVQTCDILLNITGGTVSNIRVFDDHDALYISGVTELVRAYIPYHWKIEVTYSSAPTWVPTFIG